MGVRVAGVGAGYFSRFHYDAWSRLPGATLVGICDRDGAKAAALAELHGTERVFTDPRRMLETLDIDLLDIITPPASHADLVALGLEFRTPMVVQKPLAATLGDARAMVEAAERAGIPLLVHENFRWQPWHRELRRQIGAGQIGEVYSAHFRLRPGDGRGPNAYSARQPYFRTMERFLIHETGIHFIDVFRFLFGEIRTVYADLRRLNPTIRGEDAGQVLFGHAGGARSLFDGNRLADHAAEDTRLTMGEFLIEGARGTLRLDGEGRIFRRQRGETERSHAYGWAKAGFAGDSVAAQCAHALAWLTKRVPPENDGRAYLRNMMVEEAVYRSAAEGCRITLDPVNRGTE